MGNQNQINDKLFSYTGKMKEGKKVGKWSIWWHHPKEKKYIGGGKYDKSGNEVKIGKWIEIHPMYKYEFEVTFEGEYNDGKKCGKWETQWDLKKKKKTIGGGSYDKDFKIGQWIDLDEQFRQDRQITYIGEYKNNQKVGKWEIKLNLPDSESTNIYVGSGVYEGGIKTQFWTDLSQNYSSSSKVIYTGFYKNGVKCGQWAIWGTQDTYQKIGGGQYDDHGNKIGQWTEITEYLSHKQIQWIGQYQNGKKVGQWNFYLRNNDGKPFEKIGGGMHDNQGEMSGKWIVMTDYFDHEYYKLFEGQYIQGNKVGKWNLSQKERSQTKFVRTEDFGNNVQPPSNQNFINNVNNNYYKEPAIVNWHKNPNITFTGGLTNGIKNGKWQIKLKNGSKFEEVGGGEYSFGVKTGTWIEISDDFQELYQITFMGVYKNGLKTGNWRSDFLDFDEKFVARKKIPIGDGEYREDVKQGKWVEAHEKFSLVNRLTERGEYLIGSRYGKWDILLDNYKIGGGEYWFGGQKRGMWVAIDQNFSTNQQIIEKGEYDNESRKVGKWVKKDLKTDKKISEYNYGK